MGCSSSASTSHHLSTVALWRGILSPSRRSIKAVTSLGPDDSLHHILLCRTSSLDFLCSGFPFSLLLNIFHGITAICLKFVFYFSTPPRRRPLRVCFVTPLHWQPPSTPTSLKQISTCVTSSSKDTRCAGASTTSTASICVLHTASKGMEFKRGLSWSDTPARSTRVMIKKLQVRGMGTQTRDMAQQAIHHINTHPDDTADETYCLR